MSNTVILEPIARGGLAARIAWHPLPTLAGKARDEVRTLAELCVDVVARLALGGADATQHGGGAPSKSERAQRIAVPDDLEAFNALCEARRWSDGLPLVPPTVERVERLLGGTASSSRVGLERIRCTCRRSARRKP